MFPCPDWALTDGICDPDPLIYPARFGSVTGQNRQVRVSFTAVSVRPTPDITVIAEVPYLIGGEAVE